MTEFTHGILTASKSIYLNNKGSILRTIIYTIGHFAIAITVLMLIANVSFMIALTDAIVEPLQMQFGILYWIKSGRQSIKNKFITNPINCLLIRLKIFTVTLHQSFLHF